MRTLLRLGAHCTFALLALTSAPLSLHAQGASAKSAAAPSDSASGFSIETEMLTYRALESNGEAIACDVAAYLYNTKTDFKNLPSGAICNVVSNSSSNIG